MTKSKTGILLAILLSTALLVTALIKATPPPDSESYKLKPVRGDDERFGVRLR